MKKTTLFSTLSAIAISATMLTAGFSASAVSMADANNGVLNVADTATEPNTLTFCKDITVFNDDAAYVYGPTITYTYEIAPYTVGDDDTITDTSGVTVKAKTGITGGVTLTDSTAVFNSELARLDGGKKVISDDLVASVDLTKFTSAGVYRYKIHEADSDTARGSASITRDTDNYSQDRYLDVYIKNTEDGKLKVAAYVMFHVGTSESTTIDSEGKTIVENKTDGFDSGDNNGSGSSTSDDGNMADKYYTYNYEVEKEVTGTLADKENKFPFTIKTTSSENAGKKFLIFKPDDSTITAGGTANTTENTIEGTIGTDVALGLAHGDKVTIKGLPASATVAVSESNNTLDTYKATITKPTVAQATLETDDTTGFSAKNLTNYTVDLKVKPTKNADITGTKFTNKLDDMSPTGVILTAAPYAIMLGVALFFIALYMRNKKKDESENTI